MGATAKLTIRLPQEDLDFVRRYARKHGVTITSIVNRYLAQLREGSEPRELHPSIERITGLAPAGVDAERAYLEHLEEKHR